jgi:hypothetical protein
MFVSPQMDSSNKKPTGQSSHQAQLLALDAELALASPVQLLALASPVHELGRAVETDQQE